MDSNLNSIKASTKANMEGLGQLQTTVSNLESKVTAEQQLYLQGTSIPGAGTRRPVPVESLSQAATPVTTSLAPKALVDLPLGESRAPKKRGPCFAFQRGECTKSAEECPFEHKLSPEGRRSPRFNRSTPAVCQQFLQSGKCSYGDKCKYLHAKAESLTAAMLFPSFDHLDVRYGYGEESDSEEEVAVGGSSEFSDSTSA